jgi:hypothetical protein
MRLLRSITRFDCGLTLRVVSRSRQRVQSALVYLFTALSADAERPFLNPEQSLVYIRDHLRFALARTKSEFLAHVLRRVIGDIDCVTVRRCDVSGCGLI